MSGETTLESDNTQKLNSDMNHFFAKYDNQIIERVVGDEKVSLEVEFMEMPVVLHEMFKKDHKKCLETLRDGLKRRLRVVEPGHEVDLDKLVVSLKNMPYIYSMKEINSDLLDNFIEVNCIIIRNTAVLPMVKRASFECLLCSTTMVIDQKDPKMKFPKRCPTVEEKYFYNFGKRQAYNKQCRGKWEFKAENSDFEDTQILILQENPEDASENTNPITMNVRLPPHLVDKVRAGDRINIYGSLRALEEKSKSTIFSFTMDVNNLEMLGEEILNPEILEKDRVAIEDLSQHPDLKYMIVKSIAPTIFGYENIKMSIALLLFGGVNKVMSDGFVIRGDLHVLIVGDPGTAKSAILLYVTKLTPRGVYDVGGGASGAGLTAAVVKEKGEENFTLAAGTMVLANGGIACIDELDKMHDEDRNRLHEAMAQQTVTISKGGIRTKLNAKASVLAVANPKSGKYDLYKTVKENITFPVTLLSRFDIIWIVKDLPEMERDTLISDHMLNTQSGVEKIIPVIDPVLLKKYISVAKKLNPVLDEEAQKTIKAFYTDLRKQSTDNDRTPISITPRQLQTIVRMTQAFARMHMRETANKGDADMAIDLLERSLIQVGFDPVSGQIDINRYIGETPKTERDRMDAVMNIVDNLQDGDDGKVHYNFIVDEAKKLAMSEAQVEKALMKLRANSDVKKRGWSYTRIRL